MFSGLLFAALVLAGFHHWSVVLLCMFLTMAAHGLNNPCVQAGAVAPFPREAGAAAGLLGFFTMFVALLTGTWVGASHDGTLMPLALTSATLGVLLFAAAHGLKQRRASAA